MAKQIQIWNPRIKKTVVLSEYLMGYVDEVKDFPKKGILFKDITPLITLQLREVCKYLDVILKQISFEAVAGIDARGFIVGSGLAIQLKKMFVPIRKGGKLPPPVHSVSYDLEYGSAVLEMKSVFSEKQYKTYIPRKVVIVDDVLATGGTMKAAAELCTMAGYEVVGFATVMNLKFLNDFEWNGMKCNSLIECEK